MTDAVQLGINQHILIGGDFPVHGYPLRYITRHLPDSIGLADGIHAEDMALPADGCISVKSMRTVVVFPAPLGPKSPNASPRGFQRKCRLPPLFYGSFSRGLRPESRFQPLPSSPSFILSTAPARISKACSTIASSLSERRSKVRAFFPSYPLSNWQASIRPFV